MSVKKGRFKKLMTKINYDKKSAVTLNIQGKHG